jgi:bacterioferritin
MKPLDRRGGGPCEEIRKFIQLLNGIVRNELTAINHYFLHSPQLNHWGVTRIGEYEYKESLAEMKHADELIERVLFLSGLPICRISTSC